MRFEKMYVFALLLHALLVVRVVGNNIKFIPGCTDEQRRKVQSGYEDMLRLTAVLNRPRVINPLDPLPDRFLPRKDVQANLKLVNGMCYTPKTTLYS